MDRMIIATDLAVRQLRGIKSSPRVLRHLRSNDVRAAALRVAGAERPVFESDLGRGQIMYFTVGIGPGRTEELRVLWAGDRDSRPSLGELLAAASELQNSGTPVELLATSPVQKLPQRSWNRIDPSKPKSFESYLDGHGIETDEIDTLSGTRFRVLPDSDSSTRQAPTSYDLPPPEDLPLRLGPAQERLIHCKRPLFLQGVAGSGKTTVLTHAAVQRVVENESASVLFVVFNEELRMYVEALVSSLARGRTSIAGLEVLSFRSLCDSLVEPAGVEDFKWVEHGMVHHALRSMRGDAGLSTALTIEELLDEIRATIKGPCTKEDPLISADEYVGSKYQSAGSLARRRSIHRIAEQYQEYISNRGFSDDMDAARVLLSRSSLLPKWDHVLIDESQDYTLVQLALAASLAARADRLMFAGDEHQVVHASQFSWSRVGSALQCAFPGEDANFERLAMNYRNPRSVLELGTALLRHRSARLGGAEPERIESGQPITPMPVRIRLPRTKLRVAIEKLAREIPSLGVIFPNEDRVRAHQWKFLGIDFRRGFSPQTSKGLEFEAVVLVDFGTYYADLRGGRPERSVAKESFRFSELYVSITRTRRLLIMLDATSGQDALWDLQEYRSAYETVPDIAALLEIAHSHVPIAADEGWRLAAMDFERQEAYPAAAECWQRASENGRAASCFERAGELREAVALYVASKYHDDAARLLAQQGESDDAAEQWELANNHVKAAELWESGGKLRRALRAWNQAESPRDALRINACLDEEGGAFARASEKWEEIENYSRAAECAGKAGEHYRSHDLWEMAGDLRQSRLALARHHREQGEYTRAAAEFRRMGQAGDAAECLERCERLDEAAALWKEAGDPIARLLCLGLADEQRGKNWAARKSFTEAKTYVGRGFKARRARAVARARDAADPLSTVSRVERNAMSRVRLQAREIRFLREARDAWIDAMDWLSSSIEKLESRGLQSDIPAKWRENLVLSKAKLGRCVEKLTLLEGSGGVHRSD